MLEKILNDASHPIWRIIRLAIVGIVMLVLCSTLYKNGFDPAKDSAFILAVLSALAGFDQLKTQITKE